LATLERTRLLIIDDWGPEPLTAEQRRDLLEIVDDRYERLAVDHQPNPHRQMA
jgi:DNA replication protein DnaC